MFDEIGKAIGALSPATRALAEVHRQARRHVLTGPPRRRAEGGAADRASDYRQAPEGFPLPRDVNALLMAGAIRRELLALSGTKLAKRRLVVGAGPGAVVSRNVILALGGGDTGCGQRVLQGLIDGIRRGSVPR
jgi:hypothetical protein